MMPKPETEFRQCVRVGYSLGMPLAEIARLLGSTINSVKATASKLGVTDLHVVAAAKRRQRHMSRKIMKEVGMAEGNKPTVVGVDLGTSDFTVAHIRYPDGRTRPISRSRFELVLAEAAADRFDGLGKPMMDFYKP